MQRIRESWREQKAVRAIIVFLQSHGVGTARAVRIYKTYGDRAIELVRENPYRLATDIWGIGFQSADQVAARLGIDRASPLRARAAVRFVLHELSGEGHVGYPEAGVVERTHRLTDIDASIITRAIEHEIDDGTLVRERWFPSAPSPVSWPAFDEPWLYLKGLYLAEQGVARLLRQLQEGPHPLPHIDVERALQWVERKMGLALAPSQRAALEQATKQKVLVLTGGPGTGKTTIVRGILEIFAAKQLRYCLCAPTGRAAKRLSETTGRPARTIHRLLEFDARGGFQRGREQPLDADLVIVDEASMVDITLMHALVRAIPPSACLVLVGDVEQLPSVGPGTVLADILNSGMVPAVRLTEIFRQAQESGIVRAAHRVREGLLPESGTSEQPSDFYVIGEESPERILSRLITVIQERIPARFGLDPLRDVQVLTPMNRSELGARNLNMRLQRVFNPPPPQHGDDAGAAEVQRCGWTFRIGDKVLQTTNDYEKEVFNGDVGRVSAIDPEEQQLIVDFEGRHVSYDFGELDELALAYALTVHKSQGSEYPAVVLPLHTQHFLLLQRNLLYTAITRGRQLVVVIGSRRALELAVTRQDTNQRRTALARRLRDADTC